MPACVLTDVWRCQHLVCAGGLSGGAAALEAPAGALPIFKLALRPTYWLVQRVFGPRSSRSRSSSRDKQA
jgi:hypothetical protein